MNKNRKPLDTDNPEWTASDFAKAKPPEAVLPPNIAAQFRKVRGPQRAPKKVPVSLRLDENVIEHYKKQGSGWQTKINDTLVRAVTRASRSPSKRKAG